MGLLRWTAESSALLENTGKYAQIYSRGDHRSQNHSLMVEINCLWLSVKVFITSGKGELGKEKYLSICRIFLNFFSPFFSLFLCTWTHLFVPVFMSMKYNPAWQLQRNNNLVFVYYLIFFFNCLSLNWNSALCFLSWGTLRFQRSHHFTAFFPNQLLVINFDVLNCLSFYSWSNLLAIQ